MKTRYALLIALALTAILAMLIVAVVSNYRDMMVKVFFVLAIFTAPMLIGEELYDFLDKKIDKWIEPHERLEVHWHLTYAALIGAIFLVIWPAFVVFFMNQSDIRSWYLYFRPLDETVTWLGYPTYAFHFGILAGILAFFGYLFEGTSRWMKIWYWRRHHGRRS
jgi:hypothetical protein